MKATAANDNGAAGATATPSVEHFNDSASKQIGKLTVILADPALPAKQDPGQTAHTVQATGLSVPTIEHILEAPLQQLLAEQNAQIVVLDLPAEAMFFGQLIRRKDGQVILAMPAGRDSVERDVTIRMLFAELLGLSSNRFPGGMIATAIQDGEWAL